VPAFGIISTTISVNSNKPIFGYIGMVKSGPALTNSYVKSLYMLGSSKVLNTSNNIYSENFKDITMDNQQETLTILGILRDYTREIIVLL
jgi:hypothetical protein